MKGVSDRIVVQAEMVSYGGVSLRRKEKIVSLRMKILLAAAFAAAVFVCGGCSRTVSGDEIQIETDTGDESQDTAGVNANDFSETAPEAEKKGPGQLEAGQEEVPETETEAFIYVHVCGQVKEPGVYPLKEGSRLYEAIEMAGGATEKGVCDVLNLAAVLEDGMRIMVPDKEQAAEWTQEGKSLADSPGVTAKGTPDQGAAGKVNLNRASVQELMTLSGIGQSRAEAIVRYREETGSFQTIEDVMKVSGIKENAFNKIKDNITV